MAIILFGQLKSPSIEIEESEEIIEKGNIQTEKSSIIVHVAGCVEKEGIVELEDGARIADAIEKAGGTTIDADLSKINLAYKLKDGQKLYIPSNIDEEEELISENDMGLDGDTNKNLEGKININTATQAELETLTGIGPSMATKIIEYRNKNGKFQNIEDIKNVTGIGNTKYEAIKDEIDI